MKRSRFSVFGDSLCEPAKKKKKKETDINTDTDEIDDCHIDIHVPLINKFNIHHESVYAIDNDIYFNIEEKWHTYTTKTLTFMLSDPERPIGTGSTRWFCRGEIQCSAIDYMISFDFYIYFPMSPNKRWI